MKNENSIPRWILFYVGFLALLSLSTSIMGYFSPEKIFVNTGISFDGIQPVTFFYATRNVGIFILCLFGLVTRDSKVVFSMLLMRFFVELLDLVFTIKFGIGGFNPFIVSIVWVVVFLVPEFLGAYTLYKKDFAK
jgi:hypothetical protein